MNLKKSIISSIAMLSLAIVSSQAFSFVDPYCDIAGANLSPERFEGLQTCEAANGSQKNVNSDTNQLIVCTPENEVTLAQGLIGNQIGGRPQLEGLITIPSAIEADANGDNEITLYSISETQEGIATEITNSATSVAVLASPYYCAPNVVPADAADLELLVQNNDCVQARAFIHASQYNVSQNAPGDFPDTFDANSTIYSDAAVNFNEYKHYLVALPNDFADNPCEAGSTVPEKTLVRDPAIVIDDQFEDDPNSAQNILDDSLLTLTFKIRKIEAQVQEEENNDVNDNDENAENQEGADEEQNNNNNNNNNNDENDGCSLNPLASHHTSLATMLILLFAVALPTAARLRK